MGRVSDSGMASFSCLTPSLACAVRALLASKVPPEGPWELQGIELLSQNELYRQVLLLLHLLPQDMLLLQVRPPTDPLGPGTPSVIGGAVPAPPLPLSPAWLS